MKVIENGTERTLRTVGDKWSYLQRAKFGANAQPFYVLLDNEGMPLNKSYSYDEDIQKYVEFLQTGLKNYKNNQVLLHKQKESVSSHSFSGRWSQPLVVRNRWLWLFAWPRLRKYWESVRQRLPHV